MMQASNCMMRPAVGLSLESASDAWKRCSLEMVNLISKSTGPPLIRDYNNLLLENRDLRKQYKMAISALDSMITEKDLVKVIPNCFKNKETYLPDCKILCNNKEVKETESCISVEVGGNEKNSILSLNPEVNNAQEISPFKSNSFASDEECTNAFNFKTIRKKFDTSSEKLPISSTSSGKHDQKPGEFLCSNCLNIKSAALISEKELIKDHSKEKETHVLEVYKWKRDIQEVYEENNKLKKELHAVKSENSELHDQVHSLELSLKTLTEAINLQDEQLTEYGSIVTSLKNSRSVIIEKMKEANARNNYNIMIMDNIEKQAENLKRQLDAYNELLGNQNIQQIDKASGTEQTLVEQNSYEEMKKKDNYINLLQDRLCEAIVDLKNKDSEIKNHASSVKALISNYDVEKKTLEERLKFANVSTEKLEEHKIKQQETMKQLMKLIEFLQGKLEKLQKK